MLQLPLSAASRPLVPPLTLPAIFPTAVMSLLLLAAAPPTLAPRLPLPAISYARAQQLPLPATYHPSLKDAAAEQPTAGCSRQPVRPSVRQAVGQAVSQSVSQAVSQPLSGQQHRLRCQRYPSFSFPAGATPQLDFKD
jgi:hypothetical protein